MPDLKYKCGSHAPAYKRGQPNGKLLPPPLLFLRREKKEAGAAAGRSSLRLLVRYCPIKYSTDKVSPPTTAFGKRAPLSPTPHKDILSDCSQKNKGGFSQKTEKFICTSLYLPVKSISRAASAKLISSQSNKETLPIHSENHAVAMIKITTALFTFIQTGGLRF